MNLKKDYGKELLASTGIYKITNTLDGKFYIGSAAVSFKTRWSCHRQDFGKNKNSKRMQRAYNKYGKEHFSCEILFICSPKDCIRYEQMCLDYLTPWNPKIGYNIAKIAGSNLGVRCSQSTKEKLRKINLGKPCSQETKDKIRATHLGVKKSPEHVAKVAEGNRGKTVSGEVREVIRQKLKNNLFSSQAIVLIDMISGLTMTFPSLREAERAHFDSRSISRACKSGKLFKELICRYQDSGKNFQ